MELQEKLKLLAGAAKYDVSCSSSGSSRRNKPGGLGNSAVSGICHSWADDGRCISLLKILFSNDCIFDCTYCINRISNDFRRVSFTPEEVVDLTINFYRRNYIEGLFLSSAVFESPDYTMEKLTKTAKLLREEHNFNGYIHLKAIPGADLSLIHRAGLYADRMSVNIELPSRKSLRLLAPQKDPDNILKPIKQIGSQIMVNKKSGEYRRGKSKFVPAGQSTQLIVGASPEPDLQILRLSEGLYKKFNMKRVYYSAYVPVNEDDELNRIKNPPLLREHRLYQADWLLRFYGFSAEELLDNDNPNFDTGLDPKANWALNNLDHFPLEVNNADYHQLLRVPGIGIKSAGRIVSARKMSSIAYENLKDFGTVLKRARYFITCRGKYQGGVPIRKDIIKNRLLDKGKKKEQLSLFENYSKNDKMEVVDNELLSV